MDDKEKRFVDELLRASLRHCAGAEPRPGLEGRVLAGVRARQQVARRRQAWAWAVGLAGVAAMVTLLVIYWPRPQPPPSPVAAKAPEILSAPAVAKVAPPMQPILPHRRQRTAAPSRVDKRPQQFPAPHPLSEQERLLVAYAQSLQGSSPPSLRMEDENAEHDLEIPPLTITAIKIEPLAPPKEIGDEK
jgi:hypothetical protein